MSLNQKENAESSVVTNLIIQKEKPIIEEHTVNMYFRNTLAKPETQDQVTPNPYNTKFFNMLQTQNSMILESAASNYDELQEKFEAMGRKMIKFEDKIKHIDNHEHLNPKHSEFQEITEKKEKVEKAENFMTKIEIEEEIMELHRKIEEDNKKVNDIKSMIDTLIKKITSDEELINKIGQERKSILDSIEESIIIDLTYRDEFVHNYQFDLLEIILENLNKMSFTKAVTEKVNSEFTAQYDPQLIQINLESERKKMIMKEFKV